MEETQNANNEVIEAINYIKENLTEKDLIVQAIEECSELIQALSKRYRIIEGVNPTTKFPHENMEDIVEEWTDVRTVMSLLSIGTDLVQVDNKFLRWSNRIKNSKIEIYDMDNVVIKVGDKGYIPYLDPNFELTVKAVHPKDTWPEDNPRNRNWIEFTDGFDDLPENFTHKKPVTVADVTEKLIEVKNELDKHDLSVSDVSVSIESIADDLARAIRIGSRCY